MDKICMAVCYMVEGLYGYGSKIYSVDHGLWTIDFLPSINPFIHSSIHL
jgi:hypothetical protein